MTYELARSLKDAGYSQEWNAQYSDEQRQFWVELGSPNPDLIWINYDEYRKDTWGDGEGMILCIQPTLEELIEACGEAIESLWFPSPGIDGKAIYCAKPKWDWRKWVTTETGYCEGSTSSEAVASLWLALHNKQR